MTTYRVGTRQGRGVSSSGEQVKCLSARAMIVIALVLELQGPRGAGGSRVVVAVFSVCAVIAIGIRLFQGHKLMKYGMNWPICLFVIYMLWCFASSTWSENPRESVLQAGLMMLALLLALAYADVSRASFAREFIRVTLSLSILSWVMAVITPNIAVLPDVAWRLNGPMQHPQRLSLFVGLGIILWATLRVAGTRPFETRGREAISVAILLATLVATQTRANTAFVMVVVGTVVFMKVRPWQRVLLIAALVAATAAAVRSPELILDSVGREGSNTLTLTGRTTTWSASWEMAQERIMTGFGFSSFFSPLTSGFFESGYVTPHAHNTWINAVFETGIVGATILSIFLLAALWCKGSSGTANYLSMPAVLFSMLAGTMGIVFGGKVSTLSVVVIAMIAQAGRARLEKRAVRESTVRRSRRRTTP